MEVLRKTIVFKFSDDPPAQQLALYSAFDTITMTLSDNQIWVQTLEGWSLTPAEQVWHF